MHMSSCDSMDGPVRVGDDESRLGVDAENKQKKTKTISYMGSLCYISFNVPGNSGDIGDIGETSDILLPESSSPDPAAKLERGVDPSGNAI